MSFQQLLKSHLVYSSIRYAPPALDLDGLRSYLSADHAGAPRVYCMTDRLSASQSLEVNDSLTSLIRWRVHPRASG